MSICSDCTKNSHLKERIEDEGKHAFCSICRLDKAKVFSVDDLALVISNAMQEHFESNPQTYFLTHEDHELTQTHGDPLEMVVSEMLEQNVEFFDALLDAIAETSEFDVRDGESDFFEAGAVFAPIGWDYERDYFGAHWSQLVAELKHKRRFFSESVHEFFSSLFKNVNNVKAWNKDRNNLEPVVHYFMPDNPLFRARVIEMDDLQNVINDPFKSIGPAPRNKARSGRMSPEGVVALYCALDAETAIAELRPAIGNIAAVIAMNPQRPLRLLNFERLERAMDEGWGAYLATDYETVFNTRAFLRKLHKLISQPVVPGHEADYLITQTMAEFLAHVHVPSFDGIVFKSVQRAGGINIVLFAEKEELNSVEDSFPIEYVADSLAFNQVSRVAYTQSPLRLNYSSTNGIGLMSEKAYRRFN